MIKKKRTIFIVLMSLFFGACGFVMGRVGYYYEIEGGYSFLVISVLLLLILFLYRFLDYQNASFKKIIFTGSTIAFFGLFATFIANSTYDQIISEEKLQEIIDRNVDKRIETFSGTKLDIFEIEKEVTKNQEPNFAENFILMLLITALYIFLVIIFSLIFRTDKKSSLEQNEVRVIEEELE